MTLTGTGILPQIQFANTILGQIRLGQTLQGVVTVNNIGNDTLHVSSASIGQVGSKFTLATYDQSVAPGAAGTFHILYLPTQEMQDAAQLRFTTDDPANGSVSVNLAANGVLPHMVLVNHHQTVDLGQVRLHAATSHDFAISDNGFWDLTLTNATATPPPFSVITRPTIIRYGTTEYVTVAFAPTTEGPFTGTLVIYGDDALNPVDTVFLTGTGINSDLSIDPVNVNFGLVPVYSTVRDTIQLSNAGNTRVNISAYALSPQTGVFAIVDASAKQVSVGGKAYVIVSFRPDAAGSFAGTLSISTDDANTPTRTVNLTGHGVKGALSIVPYTIDFGNVAVGHDSTIREVLKNTGQASVTISTVTMKGLEFTSGTVSTPITIKAGDSDFIDLTFSPMIEGTATGLATFTLDDNTTDKVTLLGNGVSTAGVAEDAASPGLALVLTLCPNPANYSVTAHIVAQQTIDGLLEVFDATGREVTRLPLGLLTQGPHDVSLPIETLGSGNYFVRITNANGGNAAARLVLMR